MKGAQLYSENRYKESIEVMEMSIKEYLNAEDECRYLCEGSTLQLSSDDLFVSMTSMYIFFLFSMYSSKYLFYVVFRELSCEM